MCFGTFEDCPIYCDWDAGYSFGCCADGGFLFFWVESLGIFINKIHEFVLFEVLCLFDEFFKEIPQIPS